MGLPRERAQPQERTEPAGQGTVEAARTTSAGRDALFAAVEKTRTPMILTDPNSPDDPIIFANRAFQELTGYDAAELVGRNCRFLQGPGTDAAQVQRIREALAAHRDVTVELLNYRRDGTPFVNELFISPVFGRDGRLLYNFGSQLDATDTHRTRRQLEASEQRLRAIFDSTVDVAIVASDHDGRVTDWNSGAERILGWTAGEMRGQPTACFFTPEDRAAGHVEEEMRLALAGGRASDERWHLRKDGSRFWASGEMTPLRSSAGERLGFVKVLRDRTEQHRAGEALEALNERYRLAARATNDAIWDWDLRANSVLWNEALTTAYGWTPEEVEPTGDWWISAIHPEDRDRVSRSIHATIDGTRTSWTGEYRFRRADGSHADVLDRGFIIRDREGRPLRMIGAMLDQSERKRAEAALRESADRLRLATTAARIGTFDYRVQTAELTWDDRCRELFGVPPGEPVGYEATFLAGLHPDDRAIAHEAVQRALEPAGSGLFSTEYRTVGLMDGRERWVSASGEAFFEDGRPVRLIGTVLDISERKLVEAQQRELNRLLEQQVAARTQDLDRLWRLSTDLMLVADFEARIEAVNPAWTTLLGWDRDELTGTGFMHLVHPDDVAPTVAEVGKLSQGATTLRFENRYRHKDGSYRWLSWTAVPAERLIHAIGRDVQAEKEQAEALRKAEEQLRQSHKMEAIGQLTGGLAHDFNNLLTGIIGSLELLATRVEQGRHMDLDRYIGAARGAARRAAALTHRLLAFSRRQTLAPTPVNVNRLVAGMEELIRRTMGPAIAVEVVAAGGLWTTLVDPHQLENALLNLCINARDAMPSGGKLTVETANRWLDKRAASERDLTPGQYVSLCVSDTGVGMSPDVIARAFDPFFTTKPIGQGTGLGLSMIYGFARQSGGQARIYSEVGQGAMVCLYLPRHLGEAEAAEAVPELADAPRAGRGETVMVVDDEPTVRMLVVEVLEELGYAAVEAADGASGLKVLRSDARIDLLVTDVGLPGGMNGRQMADAARVVRPDLKVLFITGYAENAVVGNGQLEPGMHVITKPFAMETLASRIKELLASN